MPDGDKLKAAQRELASRCPAVGTAWGHRNGCTYVVAARAIIEKTVTPAVGYRLVGPNGPPLWIRPLDEFLDGRFAREGGGAQHPG